VGVDNAGVTSNHTIGACCRCCGLGSWGLCGQGANARGLEWAGELLLVLALGEAAHRDPVRLGPPVYLGT